MFSWIGYLLCCWLLADFIAGVFHWVEDRYDLSNIPRFGRFLNKWITAPNRLHHDRPQSFLNNGFWYRNSTNFIPAFTAAFIVLLLSPVFSTPFFMVAFGNQVHALSHSKGKVSKFTAVLQEIGIFQSPKQHSFHHTSPYDCNYCPMTDYLNPVLEAFNFWYRFEWVIEKTTGIKALEIPNYPPRI